MRRRSKTTRWGRLSGKWYVVRDTTPVAMRSWCCMQIMMIDPSQFRVINEILQKECKGRGRIETMTLNTAGN